MSYELLFGSLVASLAFAWFSDWVGVLFFLATREVTDWPSWWKLFFIALVMMLVKLVVKGLIHDK